MGTSAGFTRPDAIVPSAPSTAASMAPTMPPTRNQVTNRPIEGAPPERRDRATDHATSANDVACESVNIRPLNRIPLTSWP